MFHLPRAGKGDLRRVRGRLIGWRSFVVRGVARCLVRDAIRNDRIHT